MKRSLCRTFELEERFLNLEPLRSPDAGLTADLHYDGYYAASRNGHYFLIRDYRPNSDIAKILRNHTTPRGGPRAQTRWGCTQPSTYMLNKLSLMAVRSISAGPTYSSLSINST